jgi:acyl carrier protein
MPDNSDRSDAGDDVKAQVRRFVVETFLFGQEPDSMGDEDSLLEKGVIDSTGVLELIEFIKRRFGIAMTDDEVVPANLDSLASIERYVARKNAEPATVAKKSDG